MTVELLFDFWQRQERLPSLKCPDQFCGHNTTLIEGRLGAISLGVKHLGCLTAM
jgi:hypothetical protein